MISAHLIYGHPIVECIKKVHGMCLVPANRKKIKIVQHCHYQLVGIIITFIGFCVINKFNWNIWTACLFLDPDSLFLARLYKTTGRAIGLTPVFVLL